MFDINDNKTFMDSVHGYISIPKCFVKHLIDTEYFQRLRNIDQTSVRILYPDAKHDRFGHSLGVFHLGSKAVDALLENFSEDKYWKICSDHNNIIFWAKNKVLFLIACLLHDIGHAPFSHSLESEVVVNSGGKIDFSEKLAELINQGEDNTGDNRIFGAQITGAPHEQVGARLVIEEFELPIKQIFIDLKNISYPNTKENSILYAEYYDHNSTIDVDDKTLKADICFIARMIIGLKYEDYTPENQIRNCFIELLNGSNFDVDKLDYIIRDTKMSGISNISIDVERLLNALSIVTKTVFKNKQYSYSRDLSDVTAHVFENTDTDKEVHIVGNFKGTLKFQQGAKILMADKSTFLSLTGTESSARIKYITDNTRFDSNTELYQNGEFINTNENDNKKELTGIPNHRVFDCYIKNATVSCINGFYFQISDDTAVELTVNGFCDIKIKGAFSAKNSISFFNDITINGTVNEIVILDNLIKSSVPTENNYNTFSVGFKKQAINIIANVLEARDYLYLWCYAHHKVIYYANFLIPALVHTLFQSSSQKLIIWDINYNNIKYIDDSYIWCTVRFANQNIKDENLKNLCEEILSRKYKKSLYKSLAEYDLIFEEFSDEQKLTIKNFFSKNTKYMSVVNDANEHTAGYINEQLLNFLKTQKTGLENISDIVFVEAGYKQKNTDAHNTFIFINGEVVPVERLSLLHDRMSFSQRNTNHYFYLYYNTKTQDTKLLKEESEILKNSLRSFLRNNIKYLNTKTIDELCNEHC